MEAWKFGGATEVGARAAAFGGDEAERCAAPTKALKAHKEHKVRRRGTADCADFEQIKGVLAHAGLPEYFSITKDTKDTKGIG